MAVNDFSKSMIYYAHSNGESQAEWEHLKDHLLRTAEKAAILGKPLGIEHLAYLVGLLHDLGKYSEYFQHKLRGVSVKTEHALAGAKELEKRFKKTRFEMISIIAAFCIAGHHTGLPDFGTKIDHESEPTLQARLKREPDSYSAFQNEIDLSGFTELSIPRLTPTTKTGGFTLSFLTRMLYSVLVDADFLSTEAFYKENQGRGDYPDIEEIQTRFQKFFSSKTFPSSPINDLRKEILQACERRAEDPQGLFSLTVPTGGGKTLSSMHFALKHARKHGLKRIIYVIPYTSIIEQNAEVFREALGDDVILEHHSNFDWETFTKEESKAEEFDDSMSAKLKLASENWDIPIVVTTNVQFFESLFAYRSSRSRKVHNMANSVIIFDEAQMIPQSLLRASLLAISELVINYKSTAVLCTATQPQFQGFLPESLKISEIMPDPTKLYDAFKRVSIVNLGEVDEGSLAARLDDHHQVLCIVNTRKHAQKLYQMLSDEGRFHLSTLMCPAHRNEVIEEIKDRLKKGLPCKVISTQLIEAGVDLDFPVGYRALAGLDSIIQAGGRVNRNRLTSEAKLFVFEPITDAIKKTPSYIQQTGDVAKQILRRWDGKDPICLEAITEYYESLYSIQTDHAFDSVEILRCFEKPKMRSLNFDFRTAAEQFKMINNDTIGIIIPRDQTARDLVERLNWVENPGPTMRKLQRYSVNIYPNEFKTLLDAGRILMVKERIPILLDTEITYSEDLGLSIPLSSGGDAFFV